MTQQAVEEQVTAAGSAEVPAPKTETAAVPVVETPAPEPQIDWKARAEVLEKQVGDFRANEIARVQAAERDRMVKGTYDSVALIAESLEEVVPGIKEKLAALQTKALQEGTTQEFVSRQSQVASEVLELAKSLGLEGIDDQTGLDVQKHPEFRTAINYWSQATAQQSPYLLERALAEAHVAARRIETSRASKTQQDAAKQLKATVDAAVKSALEKVGAKDLDAGRDAGGGGGQSWRTLSPEAKLAFGLKQEAERTTAR